MIDDPTNQSLSSPALTMRMPYRLQDVQIISEMSYLCITLMVKAILNKVEVRKADLARQLPYCDIIKNRDLVESIKEGTGTGPSVHNDDKRY
jgi:hypothetical protein